MKREAAAFFAGVGPAKSKTDLRHLVARSFTQTQMKSACVEIRKGTPASILQPFWIELDIANQSELNRLAETFLDAQQERHRADYDLSQPFTRAEVQVILERIERASKDWQTIKKSHPKVARFFALSLLMVDSWRKR